MAATGYVGSVDKTTGLPEGEGVYRWANGDSYTGFFKNNSRHGYGRTVFADGQEHEGNYSYNVPSGFGKLTQVTGDVYLGTFRKGLYSGEGKLTYANGDVYCGSWRAGLKHGAAVWTFSNGDTWTGVFRSNLPHGRGTMLFAKSGYSETGIFFQGKPGAKISEGGVDEEDKEEVGGEDGGEGESSDESSDEEAEEELSVATPLPRIGEASAVSAAPPSGGKQPSKAPGKEVHLTAKSNADFKEQGYWDERFAEESDYDWLVTFAQVRGYLLPLLPGGGSAAHASEAPDGGHHRSHRRAHGPGSEKRGELEEKRGPASAQEVHDSLGKSASILVVGCGNSSFSADLYDAGYVNITNIDYSGVVIDRMRQRHSAARPSMVWRVMDMTKLSFEAGTAFDVVIDKAAMDALMVDEGDVWDPATSVRVAADEMLRGLRAVLAPAGLFLMISFMQPHFRSKFLMGLRAAGHEEDEARADPYSPQVGHCALYDWTLSVQTIDVESGCLSSFLYTMRT